jgi:2-phospho-L-lactate/phosphoenolpyruvate guanylyltransferase
MNALRNICAVVPVKDTAEAKQRLAGVLSPTQRRELALAMLDHVLAALSSVPELAGMLVVTVDPAATALAASYHAGVSAMGAGEGHSGAIAAAARELAARGADLLTLPGDIPLVEVADIRALLAAHYEDVRRNGRGFSIVPARDRRGSNAVVCSPADAVPLRFGNDSFLPHLAAARSCGIEPRVVELPRIALDIDSPEDLARWFASPSCMRACALLDRWGNNAFQRATA